MCQYKTNRNNLWAIVAELIKFYFHSDIWSETDNALCFELDFTLEMATHMTICEMYIYVDIDQ